MIEIVINYDQGLGLFKLYEPQTDTLLMTSGLGDLFIQISDVLKERGLIAADIFSQADVMYHVDSLTILALIENNVNLLKRLNTAPSGFTVSSQRFGVSQQQSQQSNGNNNYSGKKRKAGQGVFKNSAFRNSNKKFGGQ